MNPVYEIRVEETNEHIRDFIGVAYLDLCLNTWTRLKGKKVIAIEKGTIEIQTLAVFLCEHAVSVRSNKLLLHSQEAFNEGNVTRLRELKHLVMLGTELYEMQKLYNNGRGVSCIRQVSDDLTRGDFEGAQAIAHTDWDKIRNYEDVAQFLKQNKIAKEDW